MTAYNGGKQHIGKRIADIIYEISTAIEAAEGSVRIKGYCEPFCGMLGVYRHIPKLFEDHRPKLTYKAGDTNKSIILMWKRAQKGWHPPTQKITRAQYNTMAASRRSSAIKGFYGHLYGSRGQYFRSFDPKVDKNLVELSSKRIEKISNQLDLVIFSNSSYEQYSRMRWSIIYCDPPSICKECKRRSRSPQLSSFQSHYKDDKDQKVYFDSEKFWDWCRKMAKYNIVFVSEYEAPSDFALVWEFGKDKLYSSHRLRH